MQPCYIVSLYETNETIIVSLEWEHIKIYNLTGRVIMKKRLLYAAMASVLILSGCGSGEKNEESLFNGSVTNDSATAESGGFVDYDYALDASTEESYPEFEPEPAETPASSDSSNSSQTSSGLSADEIDREMLVYSCTMSVDTLDFTAAVNGLKVLIDQYGGFIEMENFDDGGSYGRWYTESEEKWQSYRATLRIPSRNYDIFCNSAGELGDLRSKNASVQNLSSEYRDLSTSLEIYEAKEERYIAMLAGITEDEYAVAIERELTDIQIEIARIKSRMNKINTDVSYSYVYITINEVKEYISEPVKTDTFADRLLKTLSDTGRGFVEFLETTLFFVIRLIPYLILIAVLVIVIILPSKKRKARKTRLYQGAAAQGSIQAVQNAQTAPVMQPLQFSQDSQAAQNTQDAYGTQNTQGALQSTSQSTQQNAQQGDSANAPANVPTNAPTNEPPSETN